MQWGQNGRAQALQALLMAGAAWVLSGCATMQPEVQNAAATGPEETKAVLCVGNSFFYYNSFACCKVPKICSIKLILTGG